MLKILTKLDYLLKETFLGLRRGGWMNWAAVSTVTVLLFLFGMSLQTSWLMSKLINQFGTQLEVSVYMEPTANASAIMAQVVEMTQVANIETITKDQAWSNLVKELGISDIASATQQLDGNPLVDEIKVKALSSDIVPHLATELAKLQGVETVQYVDEAVKRIAQLHQGLNSITLTITIVLTLTAIAVINTTIRLIVMARRREIEVMQLVGATYTWIYLPFILQGVTFGIFGGAIAWGFITCLQQFIAKFIANQPEFIKFLTNGLELSTTQFFLLPLVLLSFGSVVGFMGSIFAVKQFAKT
ncbi:MAG: cell division protein FtsX [Mastigocoleus sp.]